MKNNSQTNGCPRPSAERKFKLPLAGGVFWALVAGFSLLAQEAVSQTLRLGPFDMLLRGSVLGAYDSNVDDVYPEEENPHLQKGDFYWMPGLTLSSQSAPMRPSTTVNVGAGLAYQDFFVRSDLDTAVYNANLNFETTHPRLTLSGMAGVDYSVDGVEDEYIPGGVKRDPVLTQDANLLANWNYRKLRLESSANFSSERHDYEEYKDGDQDETVLMVGAYLDNVSRLSLFGTLQNTDTLFIRSDEEEDETELNLGADLRLFSWGGFYYTWTRTETVYTPSEEETDETENEFGISGAIPVDLLAHPKITYSLGIEYKEETAVDGTVTKTWGPVHTITMSDELQLTKTVLLAGSAEWSDDLDEDEVTFTYHISLSQQIGPRAQHALTFTQEPQSTFGSTADTETTTYGYSFGVEDLIFYNLSMNLGASYEESTPLGEGGGETEKTPMLTFGLDHTRQISRKLFRVIAYTYTYEDSNFHKYGPNQKYLITYGLNYDF